MIETLFLSVLEISIATSLMILPLVLLSPLLNKRYAAKWKYWMWMVLALRLLVPLNGTRSEPLVVIDIPRPMTIPLISEEETEKGSFTEVQSEPGSVDITLLDIAAAAWLLGGISMLTLHGLGYVHFRRQVVLNGISIEDDPVMCQVQRLTDELQIRSNIEIVEYSQVASPMLIGFIDPILVMPDEACHPQELYFILKHELVHLKRHDIYFKLLLVAVNALHWFNPMIWLMRKEAAMDMELSCDEDVVQEMDFESRKAYTETLLLALYRQCAQGITLSTQFYGGKQMMKKRFRNILMGTKKKRGLFLVICAAMLTLTLGSLVGCSAEEMASGENAMTNMGVEYPVEIGVVNVETLNVRREPDGEADIINLLPDGYEVTVLGEENGFYQILWQAEDETGKGYARREYVDIISIEESSN